MLKSPSIIAAVLAGLALPGCMTSPWSASTSLPTVTTASAPEVAPTNRDGPVVADAKIGTVAAAPAQPPVASETQRLQDVMAELRQLGTIDPVAQDKLLEDLRQSDPSLWPLVLEQFRATQAYRRQAMERNEGEQLALVLLAEQVLL